MDDTPILCHLIKQKHYFVHPAGKKNNKTVDQKVQEEKERKERKKWRGRRRSSNG